MKILCLLVVLHIVHAYNTQPGFGRSYLRNSRLCHKWSCINTKLGLPDSLPPQEELESTLRALLPGDWQGAVGSAVHSCYHERTRRYSNTCPGQAIMHCAVHQLIQNCPEQYQRKGDVCSAVYSVAGNDNMFTQGRYEDYATNMPNDRRPAWFLKNYYDQKCCDLPALFNSTTLTECGFANVIQYSVQTPAYTRRVLPSQMRLESTTEQSSNDDDNLHIVSLKDFMSGNTPISTDPLNCCDMTDFIQPSWRQECGFELSWGERRLVVDRSSVSTTTTETPSTRPPVTRRDVMILPQTCEKSTCVFTKLNIIANGTVDVDAFSRLLDSLPGNHPSWTKAKARVVTTCLRKPLTEYDDHCEINKILSCTFDVLTENCPNSTKHDVCKHHSMTPKTCQISSSKYRPKNRRDICPLPEIVDSTILRECGLSSSSRMEVVTTTIKPKTYRLLPSKNKCQDLTPSTMCLLSKMGVLNKYGFLDYFKMKDRIRNYTADAPTLEAIYMNAFNMDLLYSEHCNSPKKVLNLLDSMLMTCPVAKKVNTEQCATIFDQINNSPVQKDTISKEYSQRLLDHFVHVFNPSGQKPKAFKPKLYRKVKKNPIYDYGILNGRGAPKVVTINVSPKKPVTSKTIVEKPLVLLPVYMRVPHSNLMIRRPFAEDGIMRSGFPMNPTTHTPLYNIPVFRTRFVNNNSVSTTSNPFSVFQTAVSTRQSVISSTPLVSTTGVVDTTTESHMSTTPSLVSPTESVGSSIFSTTESSVSTTHSTMSYNYTSVSTTQNPVTTTQRITTAAPHFSSRFVTAKVENTV